jgi:hypothetical protein
MAILLSKVRRDATKQEDGAWVEVPELTDPQTGEVPAFLVRGVTYRHFQTALNAMNGRYRRKYGAEGNAPPEVLQRDMGHLVAQHLLLDWRNVSEPYSRDLAEELCCDIDSPVQTYVLRCAQENAEIAMVYDTAAEGNSGRSSGPNSKPAVAA